MEQQNHCGIRASWKSLRSEHLTAIKAIAMDMWTPYIHPTIRWLPDVGGKIVFDRFPTLNHMVMTVDTVRRQEHRGFLRRW
jgi:transposase